MAATKQKAKPKPRAVPEGFRELDLQAKQVELEEGLELVGALGAVAKSRRPDMPDYRTIATGDGRFFVPSHAVLRGLLDLPTGTEVYLRFDGGTGKVGDAYQWTVAVRESEDGKGDLPF